MRKKDIKAFQVLESVLDADYKMLCDRICLLEKSHKRMFRLLVNVDKLISDDYLREIGYQIWENQFEALLDAVHKEVNRKFL